MKCYEMKGILVMLSIGWTLWMSHIFAISSLLNRLPNDLAQTTPSEEATRELPVDVQIVDSIENVLREERNETIESPSSPPVPIEADGTLAQRSMPPSPSPSSPTEANDIAQPTDELHLNKTDAATMTDGTEIDQATQSITEKSTIELNLTTDEGQIPVFSEWAQKRWEEEAEKEVVHDANQLNASAQRKNASATNAKNKPPVLRLRTSKNYASPDCGAKIIAANGESSSIGGVLSERKDEYLLSPCESRIWFIVELCEAVQAERIDMGNFELFSSSPQNFSVGVSSRFPTRDWTNVGRFTADDVRYSQSFELNPQLFGKYIRVDIHTYYASEHFCPVSIFRVFGTSEFEAFETENRQHPIDDLDDDDDDDQEKDTAKAKSNIFKSAGEAVMSIVDSVKKAASFVKPSESRPATANTLFDNYSRANSCVTPNYVIHCENCTADVSNKVIALLQCKQQLLNRLVRIKTIRNSLNKSPICTNLTGLDLDVNCNKSENNSLATVNAPTTKQMFVAHLLPEVYVVALCNMLMANVNKTTFNATLPLIPDAPFNVSVDRKTETLLPNDRNVTELPRSDDSKEKNELPGAPEEPSIVSPTPTSSTTTTAANTNLDRVVDVKDVDNMANEEKADPTISTTSNQHTENVENDKAEQNIFNIPAEAVNDDSQPVREAEVKVDTEPEPATQIVVPDTTQPTTTATPPPQQQQEQQQQQQQQQHRQEQHQQHTQSNEMADVNDDQNSNSMSNYQQNGQKHGESVFLRLSNRIKSLERNMSLSGQYLEELSRRYKKQVEELQLSFSKTLLNIEEQNRHNTERKQQLLEQNAQLRNDLDVLTDRIFSWQNIVLCCACFTCIQLVIFYLIIRIWGHPNGRQPRSSSADIQAMLANMDAAPRERKTGNVEIRYRRKSAEEKREKTISESSQQQQQRRPSTEALHITGTYAELLINDSSHDNDSATDEYRVNGHETNGKRGNKSTSTDASGNCARIEEIYDGSGNEYEFYGPTIELKSDEMNGDDCASVTTLESSFDGSSPQHKKTTSKSSRHRNNKVRRISSPAFLRSPFTNGGGSSAAKSTGWEWYHNRSLKSSQTKINKQKSKSESPPAPQQNGTASRATVNEQRHNSSAASSSIGSTTDLERKASGSFRRLLKKIF